MHHVDPQERVARVTYQNRVQCKDHRAVSDSVQLDDRPFEIDQTLYRCSIYAESPGRADLSYAEQLSTRLPMMTMAMAIVISTTTTTTTMMMMMMMMTLISMT